MAEVMASMVILTLALFAVLSVNAMTLKQATYNENAQTANTIACSQLAIAESVLKVNFRAAPSDVTTPLMGSLAFPKFTYQILDQGFVPGTGDSLRTVAVVVYWEDNGVRRNYQLSTIFYDY